MSKNVEGFLSQFDEVLSMDDPEFPEKFMQALGVKAGDKLEIHTPQFERTDGINPLPIKKDKEIFDLLKDTPEELLKRLGCQKWDDYIWLFPKEWYDLIPEGYEITDIFGEVKKFKHGETDDDIRFGALSFGFTKKP